MPLPGRKTFDEGLQDPRIMLYEEELRIQQAYLNCGSDKKLSLTISMAISEKETSDGFCVETHLSFTLEKIKRSKSSVSHEVNTPIETAISERRREILFRKFDWSWRPGRCQWDGFPKTNPNDYTAPPWWQIAANLTSRQQKTAERLLAKKKELILKVFKNQI